MIRLYGDPALTRVAKPTSVHEYVQWLEIVMLEQMRISDGIGLAANQIGEPALMFVMMIERGGTLTAVNPEIESVDERTHIFEYDGCLSLPGVSHPTKRYDSITLKYQDVEGTLQRAVFSGLEGVIVQHEMDHLNGKLYIDQLGKLKKSMILKKYQKLSKTAK